MASRRTNRGRRADDESRPEKRHSPGFKRFPSLIGWIYWLLYSEYSRLELFTQQTPREYAQTTWKTCFHDRLTIRRFWWKQNRKSVRNDHVYGCIGFPFRFQRNIFFPLHTENRLHSPPLFLYFIFAGTVAEPCLGNLETRGECNSDILI